MTDYVKVHQMVNGLVILMVLLRDWMKVNQMVNDLVIVKD